MSNDRFKQARRSLMNQQGQPRRPITPDFDDDAEEATALVDINELRASAEMQQAAPSRPPASQRPGPQHPSPVGRPQRPMHRQSGVQQHAQRPSGMQQHAQRPSPLQAQPVQGGYHTPGRLDPHDMTFEEDPHEATQMVDISAFNAPPLAPPSRPQPSGMNRSPAPSPQPGLRIGAPSTPAQPMAPSGYGAPSDEDTAYTNMNDFGQEPAYGAPQMPGRHEGTQTLDIDDLQEVDDFASDYDEGYSAQESTQFVDLNQLAAGAPAAPSSFAAGPGAPGAGAMSPLQDPLLTQSYAFTQESIQTYGNSTLIFTRNQQGQDVVLKRIWQGVSTQMPDDIRQRLTTLSQMHHPHLARLNGVLDSHSGCWAELERPPGQRLSYILSNGPQGRPDIALWAYPTADAIQYIHQFSILYKNLTPDAIWIDEQTRTILLEPFDLLAFEDRGNLGPYGPPELQQPAGTYPVTPATDVYSFAAVIVAALTGVPDPDQVGRIEFQSLKNELVKSLELNPTLRPTEFEPILKVLGPRIDLNPEAKKGFDKRLLIPIVLIVALLGFILFSGGDSPKKITYRQEGLPALQEGAEVVAKAPGALDEIPEVTVIQSYRYAPPEKVDPEPATDVDISEHVEKIKKHITDSKKFNKSEAEVEYKNALKLLQDIHVAQGGKLTPEQQEAYDMAMADKGFRAFRRTLIEKVEERLLPRDEKGFTPNFEESKLPYQALSIDPYAKGREFFLGNKKAQIVSITAEPPRAQKEDKTDTKEKAP